MHTVKEERSILHTIKRSKAKWFGHMLGRNCLLKHVIEGKLGGKRGRGGRRMQLPDVLKYKRRQWNFKEGVEGWSLLKNSLWKRLWTYRKTHYARTLR